MNTVNIYGIKSCSTMKKATDWLQANEITFEFHDYKKLGIEADTLKGWLAKAPWDQLINKRGTTWRKLSDEDKENIDDDKAIKLMLENTSLIKRPLLAINETIHLGFKSEQYEQIFN